MSSIEETCKALADRNRIRILTALLNYRELCACQIHEWLGVSGATTSKHLGILIRVGFIQSRKEGRWVFYQINHKCLALRRLLKWFKEQATEDEGLNQDIRKLKKVTDCTPTMLREKQRANGVLCS